MKDESTIESLRLSRRRYELLLLFVGGISIGCFTFGFLLHANLSPGNRPVLSEPALGYIHAFKTKSGYVYGTWFECFAITFGIPLAWITGLVSSALLKIKLKSSTSLRWEILASAAILLAVNYAIWRFSMGGARS